MNCPPLETMAAWLLGDLPEPDAEAFEEHYFGCDHCFSRAQRLQDVKQQLETSLPSILTTQRHQQLSAQGAKLPAVHVGPGETGTLRLGDSQSRGVWVLHSALEGVTRVDFEARAPDGALLFALPDVPFDAERGQVLLACQVHYRALPMARTMHVRLNAQSSNGQRTLDEYVLEHEFESV